MKLPRSTSLLLPLSFFAIGCTNKSIPPTDNASDSYIATHLTFTDPDLREQTTIGNITVTTDSSGLLHIDLPLRSNIDMPETIDYRITYLDQNNIPLAPPSGWTPLTLAPLPPDLFHYLQLNSSSSRATDFKLDLRYAR